MLTAWSWTAVGPMSLNGQKGEEREQSSIVRMFVDSASGCWLAHGLYTDLQLRWGG